MSRITRFAGLLFLLALLGAFMMVSSASASSMAPSQRVDVAVSHGVAAEAALVKEAGRTHNLQLMRAILKRAKVTDTVSTTASVSTMLSTVYPGCHYSSFSDKHTIALGITMGTQTITEYGFCWDGYKITWWGGHSASRWAQFGYCWTGYNDNDVWNPYPKWRTASAWGTLGGNWPLIGCQGIQWDNAHMDYANGGGIFRH